MIKPKNYVNEKNRLNELLSFDIMDTIEESSFDNLTKLAAGICEVPISLVSLIDTNRQWFKSHFGLQAKETPRDISFCGHAINNPDTPFIIEDSSKDIRFSDNPLVVGEPHVVFYIGIPLLSDKGFPLGTLCAIDNKPRVLTKKQIDSLIMLSKQVVNLLMLRKKNIALNLEVNKNSILLKEVHHRVKNNLQVITSLIRLQTRSIKNKFTKRLFNDSKNRIMAISQVHELLYQNDNLEKVDLEAYCNKLVYKVISNMNFNATNVNVSIEITNVSLKIDTVIPFGLILNEIISNSMKYAFKKNDSNMITIVISKDENNTIATHIGDNGDGISNSFFKKKHASLGLNMIKRLTGQLNGTIEIDEELEGTNFILQFKED